MLTIVLPLYKRPQYAEQVLRSLFSKPLDFGPHVTRDCVNVIISVDAGGILPPLEYDTHGTHVQVIIHQGQHFGMNRHIAWLFWQAACIERNASYILFLEEDTVPCNGWREMVRIGIGADHDVNFLALHPDLDQLNNPRYTTTSYRAYDGTRRTSSWGFLIQRELASDLVSYISSETRTWDFALNRMLDGMNRLDCYCATMPHTMHIGEIGSDFTPENHPTELLSKAYENARKIHEKVCATNQP